MDDTNGNSLAQQCSNQKLKEFLQEIRALEDLVLLYDSLLGTAHSLRSLDGDSASKILLSKTRSEIRRVKALIRSEMELLRPLSELEDDDMRIEHEADMQTGDEADMPTEDEADMQTEDEADMPTGDEADMQKMWKTLATMVSATMYCIAKHQSHEIRSILGKCCKAYDIEEDGVALLTLPCSIADDSIRITDERYKQIIVSMASQTEGVLAMTALLSAASIMMAVDRSNAIKSFARLLNTVVAPNGMPYDKSVPYVLQTVTWAFWFAKPDGERSDKPDTLFPEIIQQLDQRDLAVLLNDLASVDDTMLRAEVLDLAPLNDDMAALPGQIRLLHQLCRSEAACIGIEFDHSEQRFRVKE